VGDVSGAPGFGSGVETCAIAIALKKKIRTRGFIGN
jgi:hypothetical protein